MILTRFWQYQKERFPVFQHGLLILAFSFSALCLSHFFRGAFYFPDLKTALIAFSESFLFFLQLRIADEFKDYKEDLRWRPYRPVQRGLVTLKELAWLAAGTACLQSILAAWLNPSLLILLVVVWGYLALMSKEFFVRSWLAQRPIVYMLSHMLIIPFIDFLVTACDWLKPLGTPPHGLIWFIVLSFVNGIVLEIGRKLRAPKDEEPGVQTYTVLWGIPTSVAIWLSCLLCVGIIGVWIGYLVNALIPILIVLTTLWIWILFISIRFIRNPVPGSGRTLEHASGIWTLCLYVIVGIVPLMKEIMR